MYFCHYCLQVTLHNSFVLICSAGSLALLGAKGESGWGLHSAEEPNSPGMPLGTLTRFEIGILKI